MREVRSFGRVVNAIVEVYSECKYTANKEVFENAKEVRYNDIKCWEIVSGDDATEIENETDSSCIDDCHEYLVLHFVNGETATFRNSYVDMFAI